MGPRISETASYFDICRRKRNALDYDMTGVVSSTEAQELLSKAKEFKEEAADWVRSKYPQFTP